MNAGAQLPLAGKAVLVTGAARRVGAVIAAAFHAAGARVAVHYRGSRDEAAALVAGFNAARPDSASAFQAELADPAACESAAAARRARLRTARRPRQQCVHLLSDAGRLHHAGPVRRPHRLEPARTALPRPGRGARAWQARRPHPQHRRHPWTEAARRARRLLFGQGGPRHADAFARTRTRARDPRERDRAGTRALARAGRR